MLLGQGEEDRKEQSLRTESLPATRQLQEVTALNLSTVSWAGSTVFISEVRTLRLRAARWPQPPGACEWAPHPTPHPALSLSQGLVIGTITLTHSNFGVVFPNILYLNCLHRTDITYLKH